MTAYKRNPKIIFSKLDNDICIFKADTAEYLNLNTTGSTIWELLKEPIEFKVLLEILLDDFEAEKKIIENDLSTFLEESLKADLILKE